MTDQDNKPIQQPLPMSVRQDFTMRVSRSSNVHKLASAICAALNTHMRVTLNMLGSGPTQQAMKAWTVACGFMRQKGYDVIGRPAMEDEVCDDGKVVTVLRVCLEKKRI